MMEYYKEFLMFLSDEGHDPVEVLMHHGINGLLKEYEEWLKGEGLLKIETSSNTDNTGII